MRSTVAALIGCAVLAASGEAAASTEWVVLRVERVEVAVAHADGSPWDDANDTGLECGAGADDVLTSPSWGPVVKGFCPPRGSDPKAPDLRLRLVAEEADYVSPIAKNALAHEFMYEILVRRSLPTVWRSRSSTRMTATRVRARSWARSA